MKMNNKKRAPKKRRGAKIGLALCMAAALVLTGVYTFNQYKTNVRKEMEKIEKESQDELEQFQNANAGDLTEETTDSNDSEWEEETDTAEKEGEEEADSASEDTSDSASGTLEFGETENENEDTAQTDAADTQETAGISNQINFSETDTLIWPVDGTVLMNYSMDQTVYFATLDQYKYNPALIIGGAVNDQVISACKGLVKSIDKTAQEGTTITVDMGNGYEAIYGQLQNVQVKTGDQVEAKTVLGYLAEPTRYYSVEGCNLYFELRKDGQPIDPLPFLE